MREGKARTPDGILPEFLAILLKYPELLAWERLWHESGNEVHKLLYDDLKAIRPQADIGRHVDHRQSSWDLMYRAGSRYQDMPDHADFIKPILYHDILGPRLQSNYLEPLQQGLLKELSLPQSLSLFYAWFRRFAGYGAAAAAVSGRSVSRNTCTPKRNARSMGLRERPPFTRASDRHPSGRGWGTDVWRSDPDEVYEVVSKGL